MKLDFVTESSEGFNEAIQHFYIDITAFHRKQKGMIYFFYIDHHLLTYLHYSKIYVPIVHQKHISLKKIKCMLGYSDI